MADYDSSWKFIDLITTQVSYLSQKAKESIENEGKKPLKASTKYIHEQNISAPTTNSDIKINQNKENTLQR